MGLLEDLQARLEKVEAALREQAPFDNYIDQKKSLLGPKKHCAVVRRLAMNGDERAIISSNGRKFLLSPDAYREELKLESKGNALTLPHPADNDDFYRDLMKEVSG